MQERYWKYMVQLKAWIFYIDEYINISYKWDRRINVFVAITSSSSIAAWAIWNRYSFLWALLIAISQVIVAIKPHLPFSKRIEILSRVSALLQTLFNKADYQWYKTSNGDLSESEINDILFDLKRQYLETVEKELSTISLPEKEALKKIADSKADSFFQNGY